MIAPKRLCFFAEVIARRIAGFVVGYRRGEFNGQIEFFYRLDDFIAPVGVDFARQVNVPEHGGFLLSERLSVGLTFVKTAFFTHYRGMPARGFIAPPEHI
jgi:hypothetical protein